jgi:hypothetical protein
MAFHLDCQNATIRNYSVAYSPQVNYTDRATDRRLLAKLVPTFADKGVAWSAQRIPRPLIRFS